MFVRLLIDQLNPAVAVAVAVAVSVPVAVAVLVAVVVCGVVLAAADIVVADVVFSCC